MIAILRIVLCIFRTRQWIAIRILLVFLTAIGTTQLLIQRCFQTDLSTDFLLCFIILCKAKQVGGKDTVGIGSFHTALKFYAWKL